MSHSQINPQQLCEIINNTIEKVETSVLSDTLVSTWTLSCTVIILIKYLCDISKFRKMIILLDFSKIPITIPDGSGYCPETEYANNKMFGSIELRSP